MNYRLFIPAVIGLCYPLTSLAETIKNEEQLDSSPIIVTASRVSETVDETLASVSVITRQTIEKSSARSVADLLRMEAGVEISRNGGPASNTSVFLRGTNSNQTLFLVDGMRVASATTGAFAFEQMNLNEIERIEIVRGPRSTQYGSDAIGGIIQIFTRKNEGHHARIGFGSYGTKEASAGIRIGKEITFRLNASREEADGFSATNPDAGFFYNPDDDPYKKNNANAALTIPLGKTMKLDFNLRLSDSEVDFDQGTSKSEQQDIITKFDQQINSIWSHKVTVGYNHQNLETVSTFPSDITSERTMFDWQNDIVLSDSLLLLVGLSRYEDNAKNIDSSQTVVFDNKISNNAIFTNLSYSGSVHDFLFSLRGDDHSTFGSVTTGLASWGIAISSSLRFTTSLSNGFRAPTLNELYHPGFPPPFFEGNSNLKPEESEGGEISLRWKSKGFGKLNVTYFHNNIDNLISYAGINSQAINIAKTTTKGFEIQHRWRHDKWTINSNATLQKAYNNESREDLIRRPREKLTVATTYDHSKNVSARLEVIYSSKRLDGFGTKEELPSYTLLNLSSRIKLQKHMWLDLRIDNITNKQYEYAQGFNTADRSLFFGVSYDLSK